MLPIIETGIGPEVPLERLNRLKYSSINRVEL